MDMQFDEKWFKDRIKPHILKCREGDWNHAKRTVVWVKVLGKNRDDLPLLITTAYIHDIGWKNVLPKGKITYTKLLKYEKLANKNSKPFVKFILRELHYSDNNIYTVNRLIESADKHNSNKDDEAIIVDADNLSKLSINHLKEKFHKSEWVKMYNLWKIELPKRIKTKKAKTLYPDLLDQLKLDIDSSL